MWTVDCGPVWTCIRRQIQAPIPPDDVSSAAMSDEDCFRRKIHLFQAFCSHGFISSIPATRTRAVVVHVPGTTTTHQQDGSYWT
jgi:hypothetical protein